MTNQDSEDTALDRAIHKAECSPQFSEEEVRALRLVADAWRGLEALGRVAGLVRKVLQWLGWAVAAYLVIKSGAIDFIKGASK